MTFPHDDAAVPLIERPPSRKAGVMAVTGLVASLMIAVLTIAPSPFAIAQPGPTYNTLAVYGDTPVVSIEGLPTYEASGELRLTTVSYSRGGSRTFTLGQVIGAYLSPNRTVQPEENVFGTRQEQEGRAQYSQQLWVTSQESATVAALEALDITVPATLTVAQITEESRAVGILRTDDVLVEIDGEVLVSYNDLTEQLAARAPGDSTTFTVLRDGRPMDVTFDLIANPDQPEQARMGILVNPAVDLPITVTVAIEEVSGSSGGMMFALAIMDKLTPDDELGGAHVAGTGTIDIDGQVGPIGGIAHKLRGAVATGATSFLAPVENCDDVVGHIPSGLSVYAVDTLADAYAAMVAIGNNDTTGLPTCASVMEKE